MNKITIIFGIVILLYGIYTFLLRFINPHKLSKLKTMKRTYGELTGYIIHLIFYSALPLVFGVILVYIGYHGISLF